MKVILLNGSPHEKGCTFTALSEIAKELEKNGIESEILQLGKQAVHGCIGCGKCHTLKKCVFEGDIVNEAVCKIAAADGFVVGSPVYFASANGSLIAALDRIFSAGRADFAHKPAAAIASARRAGTTATVDELNKYFGISRMPIVTSQYWPMVHGNTPDEVKKDEEGMQIMQTLADEMAWLIKSIEAGKKAGVELPTAKPAVKTNFIRP